VKTFRVVEDAIRRLVVRGAPVLGRGGRVRGRDDDLPGATTCPAGPAALARPGRPGVTWPGEPARDGRVQANARQPPDQHQPDHDPPTVPTGTTPGEEREIEADAPAARGGDGPAWPQAHDTGGRPGSHARKPGRCVEAGGGTAFAVSMPPHQAGRLARHGWTRPAPDAGGPAHRLRQAQAGGQSTTAVLTKDSAPPGDGKRGAGRWMWCSTGAGRMPRTAGGQQGGHTYSLAVLAKYHHVPGWSWRRGHDRVGHG